MPDIETFAIDLIAGYCMAMLWANTRDADNPEEDNIEPAWWQTPAPGWQLDAFGPASQASITADCTAFVRDNWRDLSALPGSYGRRDDGTPDPSCVAACAGHDFALTRNGAGVGFWDRGLGTLGDRLSDAAGKFGESGAWFTEGHPVQLDSVPACRPCLDADTDCYH